MEKSMRKKLIILCVIMAIAMSIMPILPLRVNAAAVPVAGFGKAIKFSGASYVQIPNNTSHAITDNFTVELWFKSSSLTQKDKYLISRNGAGTYGQWGIIYGYTAKTVEFYSGSYSGADPRTGSQILINDTNWHHIAYTHNGSTGEWCGYLDGVKVFSRTSYFILPTDPVGNPGAARNLYIGGTNNTDNLAEGCIDEVRIWNEPLDAGEIDAWMYSEIDSTHPDYLSLQNYYKLNDGSGTAVADTMSRADGILYGSGAIWQNSDIRSWTTNEDTAVTGYLVGSDTDGAAGLSYEIVNPGTMGTASIISGNRFQYVPNADANGSDTFTYRVTDGVNTSNIQTVNITINPVNDPPVVSDVQISGMALVGGVLTGSYNYYDAENDANISTFQWYRSNDLAGTGKTAILGATEITYILTSADLDKYISLKVTPAASAGTSPGTWVESPYTLPVENVQEQFTLPPGGTYYFDLSARINDIKYDGTAAINTSLPDSSLKWVPFTYAGTVNAYSRTTQGVSTSGSVAVGPRSLFVADYAVGTNVSWNGLDSKGLIFGSTDGNYSANGISYNMRSLSVGSTDKGTLGGGPDTNEWDQVMNKNSDYIKNWYHMFCWGQDTLSGSGNESKRVGRSWEAARYFGNNLSNYRDANDVFRPALEILNVGSLGEGSLKTVTYNMGTNGTLGSGALTQASVVYTGTLILPAVSEANGFHYDEIRPGKSLGWLDSEGNFYAAGTPLSDLPSGTTLTAGYDRHTVSYDANGGSGSVPSGSIVEEGASITVPDQGSLSLTGHRFDGWNTKDDGTGINYGSGSSFTMGSSDVTLYAKWAINNYEVRFESNGGSTIASQHVNYNSMAIEPATPPAQTGYTFAGWYSDIGLTTPYAFTTPVTGDITLYAKWSINSYTVSFNSNGGNAIDSQHINYNGVAAQPDNPTRIGYNFAGWCSDIGLTSIYNFATPVTADITLYAKWTINSYTVSFNSNGGSTVDLQHINYNGAAVQPDNPTRVGYTFVGWCSDIGLTSPYDFATPVTADITLYAEWTINSYTVSFESNGGSAVDSQHINYNSTAVEPAVPPTKTGYSFAGWCSNSGLTNAYDFATLVTADITLYARWTNLGPTGTVIINGGNALTNNTLVALTLSASDPGGDAVTDMCFSDDGAQWTAWKVYAESESYTLPSGDGSKTVYVKFRDSADSIGSAASASIELDTIPPVIAGVADNTAYNVDVIPSFTEGIATLSQNGGSADIFTSGTPVSAEGSYDLEVADAAGNTAAISFSIDKTAPLGTLSINNGEENTTSQSVSLAITSSDGNGSGQLQMRFSNDGSTWSPWEAAAADKQWTIQSAYGTATVYMQLKDRAGNISGNITDTILYRSVPVSDGSATDGVEDSNLLLSANDFAYSNPDGNLLSKIMIVSLPLHGTLKLGDTDVCVSQEIPAADLGALVFIPERNWNGTTSFAWKGSDGINYSVQEAEIIINIAPVNDAPVANDGSLTTNAGTAGRGTLSATDLEGDSLSYSIEAQGGKGEAVVTDSATGAYTYTPYDGEFGSDSFTFKVNDGSADSNTATVMVNIIPSGVADLSALSVREGVLAPEFEVNTMDYFVSVSNVVNDLTVTASVYDIYSTVQIDNTSVTDAVYGEYSKIISLDVGVNTICIDVTSQDGLTTKTYTITATRAPSHNAELASVNLGIRLTPDFSPDITTYSGTVGNGVGSITLKPVAADRTDTIKVNGNTLTGSSAVVALNVGSNSIVIEVTAQDGIAKKTYTFSIYRLEASNRDKEDHESGHIDSTPETIPKPAETDTGVNIYVNGKAENAGIVTTTNAGGRTTTSVVVDESKLEQNLAGEGNNAVITIPVNTNSEVMVGELNGRMIKSLENKEAVIEIKTGTATYTLPARQINIDAVSAQLGTQAALQDIKVQIEISQPAAETVKMVENMADQNGFSIVAPPMEFNVRCTYGGRTVRVESFNAFVERRIAIPDNVDPNKITTGIIIDPDGTMRHVPTRITIVDGKYYAVINSLSNSLYSVIWHPVEFKDAAGHWAEKDIDDMGSRMIMGGAGGGKFEPDRGITRAEFTAAVVRALGLKPDMGKNPFEDVKPSDWYCEYIETAYEYGIISGYGKRFGPADKITREQAEVIIERAMRITGLNAELLDGDAEAIIADFGDAGQVPAYAKYGMAACIKTGIITIGNEKLMAPKENITRAEAAVIIRRLLQKSNLI